MCGCGPRTVFWLAGSGLTQLSVLNSISVVIARLTAYRGAYGANIRFSTCSWTFWLCAMDPPSRVTLISRATALVKASSASM